MSYFPTTSNAPIGDEARGDLICYFHSDSSVSLVKGFDPEGSPCTMCGDCRLASNQPGPLGGSNASNKYLKINKGCLLIKPNSDLILIFLLKSIRVWSLR